MKLVPVQLNNSRDRVGGGEVEGEKRGSSDRLDQHLSTSTGTDNRAFWHSWEEIVLVLMRSMCNETSWFLFIVYIADCTLQCIHPCNVVIYETLHHSKLWERGTKQPTTLLSCGGGQQLNGFGKGGWRFTNFTRQDMDISQIYSNLKIPHHNMTNYFN